jgi:hypothetical protein
MSRNNLGGKLVHTIFNIRVYCGNTQEEQLSFDIRYAIQNEVQIHLSSNFNTIKESLKSKYPWSME